MTNNEKINLFLKNEFQQEYFINLKKFLNNEYKNKIIFPQKKDIFNFLKLTDFNSLKVVIIGQDPYHGENEAHGLAFSTLNRKLPPSLKNIYLEIQKDYPNFNKINGDLSSWAKQGVLLLNRILTVQKDKPMSHADIGWENFSFNLLSFINNNYNNVIFLLLGKKAQEIQKKLILNKQIVINLSHPSPFSYSLSFKNSRIFKKINQTLKKMNKNEIIW
ncbi:uracil-DNA glycosylase [Mesomycoplasma neurolyticum]|uniref:Uracil-DNA glycosylase n=1 Tax=Mesomycoplasma neurolyticum TaxID=2120 RepID=A0A449A4P8_9BACT|nr:uracil-DNA glycosylase [Mesomycoplasma neurolyticum]VEU59231.1 uracil-DNA glycosylase [Mesomycoplasma neurolyticum]